MIEYLMLFTNVRPIKTIHIMKSLLSMVILKMKHRIVIKYIVLKKTVPQPVDQPQENNEGGDDNLFNNKHCYNLHLSFVTWHRSRATCD